MQWLEEVVRFDQLQQVRGVWIGKKESDLTVAYPDDAHGILQKLEDKSYWFRHKNQTILTGMKRFPPKDNCIIEVGGGNGAVAAALQHAGYQVAMFEPGPEGIANAKRRGVSTLFQILYEDALIYRDSAPALGLFDVLEHIPDDVAFLSGLLQSLAPGGRLYLTVPAYQILWSESDDFARHQRRYTMDTLQAALRDAGFEPVYATHFFRALTVPIFLFRSIPYRLSKRKPIEESLLDVDSFSLPAPVEKTLDKLFQREIRHMEAGRHYSWGASIFGIFEKPIGKTRMNNPIASG